MHKIMIVEDEDILRMAYIDIFTAENFDVEEAANGKIALAKLPQFRPDLIILDVLMPVMGGIDFLRQANILENYATTKVLVLSNLSDKATMHEVVDLGATKHFIKSNLSPRELVNQVHSLLKQ